MFLATALAFLLSFSLFGKEHTYINLEHEGTAYRLSFEDLDSHLAEHLMTAEIEINASDLINTNPHTLALRNLQLVKENDSFYLECSVSKSAWEQQRNALAKRIRSLKMDRLILGCMALVPGICAGISLGTPAEPHDYAYKFTITAYMAAAALLIAHCSTEKHVNVQKLTQINADPVRIPGFRKMLESGETVRIRTDFPVDKMQHVTLPEADYTVKASFHNHNLFPSKW